MQVRAIATGVDDKGFVHQVDDVFPCPKGRDKNGNVIEITKATWYVPIEDKPLRTVIVDDKDDNRSRQNQSNNQGGKSPGAGLV